MIPVTKGRSACVKTADLGWNHLKSLMLRPLLYFQNNSSTFRPKAVLNDYSEEDYSNNISKLSSYLHFHPKILWVLLLNMFSFLRRSKEHIDACCYTNVYSNCSWKITFYSQVSTLHLKFKIVQRVSSVSTIQLGGPSLIPNHYISVRITNKQAALYICLENSFEYTVVFKSN